MCSPLTIWSWDALTFCNTPLILVDTRPYGNNHIARQLYQACVECCSWNGGCKTFCPPLQPIPVGSPFHRVAVDILQLPLTISGNCYVAVFMDYLAKSPFFLLYGRDARPPTETAVTHVRNPYLVDIDDYREDLLSILSLASAENIRRTQKSQKRYYDCSTRKVNLRVGYRIMVYMPSEEKGEEHKLRQPFWTLPCVEHHRH